MNINPDECCLLIVDIQEKLLPSVFNKKQIVKTTLILLDIALNLEIPIIISEQYPKGLGETINVVKAGLPKKIHKIEKTTFSCLGSKIFEKKLKFLKRKQILLVGIETHICILQSALDLKARGYEIFLVENGIGSRKVDDHELGVKRMLNSGVNLTNIEMTIFELVRDSKHELFKYFSKKYIK